jgi:hypothetical protein
MGKKRRTEITIETERLLLLKGARRPIFLWCEECRAEVKMVTPEEAAAATGVRLRAIYRRVEAGELHFTETPEGQLLICLNSILR